MFSSQKQQPTRTAVTTYETEDTKFNVWRSRLRSKKNEAVAQAGALLCGTRNTRNTEHAERNSRNNA